ncbi:ABC-type amino acid transport/signal transduction systems, periplasmic component/domain [Candidatus Moduliflexus flocculans]|uniref:ABC-type amino acid transport/signal transduction systems, periplasmic component/domain n=1 Tax=Candidatus Moduliflexus flocculans TaxID=1499966 RepID=A0A081BTL0_9BACT|nr:ABC-type amino acid transport/signal transduction systems, periplasmic component/domain [Candidatus Moduliflexus flocculans]
MKFRIFLTSPLKQAALALAMIGISAWHITAQEQCQVKIAWEPWYPFQYQNANGKYTGIDIDIITAILEKMGCQYEFLEAPWARAIKETQLGRIHLLMGASKTPEREAFAYFSTPYRQESFALFVRKGDAVKYQFTSLRDMLSVPFRLGVTRGYYYGEEFAELSATPEFQAMLDEMTQDHLHYAKLIAHRIDGFLAEPMVSMIELRKKGLSDQVEMHPFRLVSNDISAMFSKQIISPEFVQTFNRYLAELQTDGTFDAILKKYQAQAE